MHLIGVWLIYCESFRNESYIEIADAYSMENTEYRKIMTSVTRDVIGWTGGKNRAESLLNDFFHDADDNIRSTASSAFRNIDKADFINHKNLCHNFINSPAFEGHSSSMLYKIEDVVGNISDIVISSAERIINTAIAKKQTGDTFSSDLHQLQDHLKSSYLA